MKLFSSLLTFSLLFNVRVSCRGEIGSDRDPYGEAPRPTSEPLSNRDGLKHGTVLMETRLGYQRGGTSRRNFALGARQVRSPPDAKIVLIRPPAYMQRPWLRPLVSSYKRVALLPPGASSMWTRIPNRHPLSSPHRFAAPTLSQPSAVASAPTVTVSTRAVMMARSPALIPSVRILFLPVSSDA